MWKKLIEKKSLAILLGLLPVLVFLVVIGQFSIFRHFNDCEFGSLCDSILHNGSIFIWTLLPFFSTLFISIPAYFMRKEVHDVWFKWMILRYMPVACFVTYLITIGIRGSGGGGWAIPDLSGVLVLADIAFFSTFFILLSIILIAAQYWRLRKRK